MATLDGFRDYARIDYAPEEDGSIRPCFEAALSFASMAGIPPEDRLPVAARPLYDLMVYALALNYYENRGFSPGVSVNANVQTSWVDRQVTAIKTMLEYASAEPEDGGAADGGA